MKLFSWLAALLLCGGATVFSQAIAQPASPAQAAEPVRANQSAQSAQSAQSEQDAARQDGTGAVSPAQAAGTQAASPSAGAQPVAPAQAQAITRRFEQRFPGIQVDAVRATPMAGLFEVQVGLDLVYADAEVDYVLQGSLIDARARRDLTAERVAALQHAAFDQLPLQDAIRQVKGTGARQVAVFEDPNCGYCKQFHRTLEDVDDVTVYTFLFPILTPDSSTKARDIWCASDPAATWKAWMVGGTVPEAAQCDTPLLSNLALGRKLGVQGTPALFFADGTRVNGTLPLDALREQLDAHGLVSAAGPSGRS